MTIIYHGWTPSQQTIDNLKREQNKRDFQHYTSMKAQSVHCKCSVCLIYDAIDRDEKDEQFTRSVHSEFARGR